MSADREPLAFHDKQPRRPKAVTEDPEEADEEESDEAENGFSLEEVLRLGGTKVTAAGSGECETRSPTSRAVSRSWAE